MRFGNFCHYFGMTRLCGSHFAGNAACEVVEKPRPERLSGSFMKIRTFFGISGCMTGRAPHLLKGNQSEVLRAPRAGGPKVPSGSMSVVTSTAGGGNQRLALAGIACGK